MNPVDVPNFTSVCDGIYRGGQPTDAGWNYLHEIGITQVIKLNLEGEGSDVAAEALGMKLTYMPIDLDDQLIFRPREWMVETAVAAIKPGTFVHCEHGQDRTGLVIGCYRVWVQGWTKADAWREMRALGFHEALLGLSLFWAWYVQDQPKFGTDPVPNAPA